MSKLTRREVLRTSAAASAAVAAGLWDANAAIAATTAWRQPQTIRARNGVLKVTLTARQGLIPFAGGQRWAMTYDGVAPGPTLRMRPGDLLEVTLVNRLNEPTNLHTHGLHVSPGGVSDNPFLMVDPGERLMYRIRLPKDHPSGLSWYHPHHHGLVAAQLSLGMTGMIVVDDGIDVSTAMAHTSERLIMLSDPHLGTTAAVRDTTMREHVHGRAGAVVLLNGVPQPTLQAKASKIERWRLVNASASRIYSIQVEDAELTKLGADNGRLGRPVPVNTIWLAPGERGEYLVRPKRAGSLAVMNAGEQIGTLVAPVAPATPAFTSLPVLPSESHVDRTRTLTMQPSSTSGMMMGGTGGAGFSFDGKPFDPNRIDQEVKLNTTEVWHIKNLTGMPHPFHIHTWPFQVLERSDGVRQPGWKDTVLVPPFGDVRIRIDFRDFVGTTLYHCHILDHEDAGMMGVIRVSA